MRDCNSCGKCCVKYGNGRLSASSDDIKLWESFRPEISDYVKKGQIWHEPTTGELLSKCPWLEFRQGQQGGRDHYTCAIYNDRPEDCRVYPANIADMVADQCEMLEEIDLVDFRQAERSRIKLMGR